MMLLAPSFMGIYSVEMRIENSTLVDGDHVVYLLIWSSVNSLVI